MRKIQFLIIFVLLCFFSTVALSVNDENKKSPSLFKQQEVAQKFELQTGDLLFQDLDCGTLCNGIGQVTYGVDNTYMSHVGIVDKKMNSKPVVIEAISQGVVETPLSTFLARSHDKNGDPMVLVGRLKPQYQKLIPSAIDYSRKQIGKPYNASFIPNNGQSFYCSQLVYFAFTHANHNKSIFQQNQMNFTDSKSKQMTAAWKEYFDQLKVKPPQGKIGTNPGLMSRESNILIVHKYGQLRVHKN